MPGVNMYDRMGDLLSDFLETGTLPSERDSVDTTADAPVGVSCAAAEDTAQSERVCSMPTFLIQDFARLGFSPDAGVPPYSECRSAYKKKLLHSHPDLRNMNPVLQKAAAAVTQELLASWKRISAWYAKQKTL